jgi:RNA-directed DNA polymerase
MGGFMIVQKTQHMTGKIPEKYRLLQRKLYCAAKANPERNFGILYDKVCRLDILEAAWKRVKSNGGSAGTDGVEIDFITDKIGEETFIKGLQQELISGQYRPQPVLRKYIPKGNGKKRPLGIPTLKDRVAQMAVKLVIEPLFEADFQSFSYGFRPKKSAEQAIQEVRKYINWGGVNVIEVDLKSYFDNIPHDKLMQLVRRRISDRRVLRMIERWIKVGVMEEGKVERSIIGTPQGGVISPLLANIFLNELDKEWEKRGYNHPKRSAFLVRYADDMVVLCRWKPEKYFSILSELLKKLGVEMNFEKSKVVHAQDGFDFLGVHFHLAKSARGRMNCYNWPSTKAVQNYKNAIRKVINHRIVINVQKIIFVVNPIIRGWGNYFRSTNSATKFSDLDIFTRKRIYKVVRKSRKIRGYRCGLDPSKLYDEMGLISLWKLAQYHRAKAGR